MTREELAQARALEIWYAMDKETPTGERIVKTILAVRDEGLPTAHLRFMGGGGPDEWEWWED